MIVKRIIHLLLFYIFTYCFTAPKIANAQVIDSMYYGWVVYEMVEKDVTQDFSGEENKKCYIASTPYKSNSSYTAYRNPYLSIARYSHNRSEEITVYAGYEYKISSKVYLLIGDQQKRLFTKDEAAWAENSIEDKNIIQLMLNNSYVKVRSDSSTGNYAVDEYETKGLLRAYARMKELCR